TPHTQLMADTANIQNNVVPAHNGNAPLIQGYKGSGIIIGVIDTGIDFDHPDFKDSLGNTRIKYLWDQRYTAQPNSPQPYNYGQEWDSTDIATGNAAAHDVTYYYGHGTHITGVAAGNGRAINKYKGVAPESDIIFVALDFNSSNPTLITDAIDYIYKKADSLGKPCVINCSFGDYYGSHDGNDLQAQIIKNMINAQTGRVLVGAAGNGGNIPFHLGYTVTSDTSFTFFKYTSNSVYLQMWADTNNLKNVDFSIGADQMTPAHSFRGRLPFSDITSHLGVLQEDTLYNNGNRIGIVQSYGDLTGGTYSMEFNIIPDSTSYYWRLITTGSGKFDLWNFDVIRNNLPLQSTMPDSIYYKLPDYQQTIVSSFQCLDEVITVGNYTNNNIYLNYAGTYTSNLSLVIGELSVGSSRGPTRDGRIKPDIAATGDYLVSCLAQPLLPTFLSFLPGEVAQGGFHKKGNGTSASSPVVAGAVALYLEKNPNATAFQAKQAVISCPKTDIFTGTNLPDNEWGYGKVDVFTTLTGCSPTGVEINTENNNQLLIYPNPSSDAVSFSVGHIMVNSGDKMEIHIYNAIGKLVKIIPVNNSVITISNELAAGLYSCELLLNKQKISSEKLVILRP
ncbi:MAG: S8 family peptidase, partial [Bacteroidia bacterium]|nr:S8 family peptidase [Bacteroidia bacterium]